MFKFLSLLLAVSGGMMLSLQAGINGALGKQIGTIEATLVSFLIGTLLMVVIVLCFGNGALSKVADVPRWQLLGGVLGLIYLTVIIAVVPLIGVASSISAVIVGQLTVSMMLDHFGVFKERIPFDGYRLAAILMMAGALALIYRGSLKA